MTSLRVRNASRDTLVAESALWATGFWARLKGLLGTSGLKVGEGMILEPCSSVHMWGMRYPLDVLFADSEDLVIGVVQDLKPWRLSKSFRGARRALELPVGTIESSGTQLGDRLSFELRQEQ